MVLLGSTPLAVAPSLLLMTSFTRIFIVLALSRNALGLQGLPPNQILAGLALGVVAQLRRDPPARQAEHGSALAPTQVWAAVDAHRPSGELRAELGRAVPVGALAIRNASSCTRPGALLGLGFPVGWLDGLPASRVVWTRLLEEAATTLVAEG